jgi:hypothetical protein
VNGLELSTASIPEPSACAILALVGVIVIAARRRSLA